MHDDRKHLEFLILEAPKPASVGERFFTSAKVTARPSQILTRKVARFDEVKMEEILLNPAVIRNRLKVNSAVHNARLFLDVQKELGTFDAYCWQFVGGKPKINRWRA